MARPRRSKPYRVFYRADKKAWCVEFGHGKERGQRLVPDDIKGSVAANRWADENFGDPVPIKKDGSLIEVLADRWIKLRWSEVKRPQPRFSPATVANNESHCTHWIKKYLGNMPISQVGTPELREFLRTIRDQGRGPVTTRNVYYSLVAFYDDVRAEGWAKLPNNPAREPGVQKEVPPAPNKRGGEDVCTLPVENAQRVIVDDRVPIFRRVQYAGIFTGGWRPGELPALHWGDLDLDRARVRIERQLSNYDRNKNAKGIRAPKYGSKRTLPLHACAVAALRDWQLEWEIFVGRLPGPNDPVFPDAEGKYYRPRHADLLREDLELVGLPTTAKGKPITMQAARRSVSSWLRTLGVAKETRARLLGHSDEDVTERNYTDDDLEDLRRAVALIPLKWESGFAAGNAASVSKTLFSAPPVDTISSINSAASYPGATFEIRTRDLRFTKQSQLEQQALPSAKSEREPAVNMPDRNGRNVHARYGLGSETPPLDQGFAADEEAFLVALVEHSARAEASEVLAGAAAHRVTLTARAIVRRAPAGAGKRGSGGDRG